MVVLARTGDLARAHARPLHVILDDGLVELAAVHGWEGLWVVCGWR